MGCFYSQHPHSHHPPLFCLHTSLIFEKQFDSTCPQSWLLEDMKTHRKRPPMQGSGSRLEDERSKETQIKPSQYQHRLYKEETNNTELSINVAPVSQHTSYVIKVPGQRGYAALWGSGSGWRSGCCPYLSTALQRTFKLLPAGIHKVFEQQSAQHSLTPALWESADGGGKKSQDKLHTGHFGRVVQVYCSSNEQICFKTDHETQYPSEIHIFTSVKVVCLECAANFKHLSYLQHLVLFLTTHSETIKFIIAPIRIKRCLWSNETCHHDGWNLQDIGLIMFYSTEEQQILTCDNQEPEDDSSFCSVKSNESLTYKKICDKLTDTACCSGI